MRLTSLLAGFGLLRSQPAPNAASPTGRYRPDIDGLRAVAVLGVILFHYGFRPPGGGFIGVDIFFVISGFLITSILGNDLRRGRFSLAAFYERRLRRILPALLLVLFCCAAASTTLLPNDLKRIGLGYINAATFTSNFFFASMADDYFAAGALASQPALHTWSLGVEAQFYLVFPALCIAGFRWPAWRRLGFATLFAASLGGSLWGVVHWPEETFYLLPARLWEFLLGGALAAGWRYPPPGRAWGALVGAVGLGMIGAGFVLFSPTTPFPGAAALLPCLGAAMIIAAGGGNSNPVSRLLGAPPLALIGRMSYSLYLWHWPILVFASYGRAVPLGFLHRLELLALTGLVSFASWWFVERTIIERRWLPERRTLVRALAAGVLGVAGLGLTINLAGQNKIRLTRLPDAVLRLADGEFDSVRGNCLPGDLASPACRFGLPDAKPSFAIWGNSFARMWAPGLDAAAKRHRMAGVGLFLSKCPPLIGVAFPAIRGCAAFNRDALGYIEAHPALKTVILGGNWGAWTNDLPALGRTIEALRARGRIVVVLRSPPKIPYPVPRTLALAELRQNPPPPPLPETAARAERAKEDEVIDRLETDRLFTTVDPFEKLCDGQTCAVERDDRALYYDDAHVTRFAAELFSTLFDPVFGSLAAAH